MSKRLVLLAKVPNLGARGLITRAVPEHYAKVLIRRGLAKIYEPEKLVKLAPEIKAEPQVKVDFSSLKKAEMKAELERRGIEFDSGAKKSELLELLEGSE